MRILLRLSRPVKLLLILIGVAACLILIDRMRLAAEISLATGTPNNSQREYFHEAATRPGYELFFSGLPMKTKEQIAYRISEHPDDGCVRLALRLVDTIDPEQNRIMKRALLFQFQKNPVIFAPLISVTNSRQRVAVFEALSTEPKKIVTQLIRGLNKPENQANTKVFLAKHPRESEVPLIHGLASKDREIRIQSAGILGEIRSSRAAVHLAKAYRSRAKDEKIHYLVALCNVQSTQAIPQLSKILLQPTSDHAIIRKVANSLARLRTPESLAPIARLLLNSRAEKRKILIESLSLAGEYAIRLTTLLPEDRLQLALNLKGPRSDQFLISYYSNRKIPMISLTNMSGRPGLVSLLKSRFIKRPTDDHTIKISEILATTTQGKAVLRQFESDRDLGGIAQRALTLVRSSN